jgi:7-cyano-7-deazaguanine synthase in queuosine biosynthesis
MIDYDKILKQVRGYTSKLPDNKKAVMIISGGLDSVITCARLISEFGLEIFPLHVNRGQTNRAAENKSAIFFSKYLKNKFKGKIHDLEIISLDVPPKEIKPYLLDYMKKKGHPLRDTVLQIVAVQYAISLSQKYNQEVKTIFSATGPEDPFPHCTLQSFRANTINTCENLGDWEWTITSPNIDKNIFTKSFGKVEEIVWADKNKIPLEKTISCYKPVFKGNVSYHCGECLACRRRKKAFFAAKIKDKTKYII